MDSLIYKIFSDLRVPGSAKVNVMKRLTYHHETGLVVSLTVMEVKQYLAAATAADTGEQDRHEHILPPACDLIGR